MPLAWPEFPEGRIEVELPANSEPQSRVAMIWNGDFKWKEKYTSDVKTVTVEVNKVTWWQKTQIWMGRILMVLIVAAGVYVTLKLAKKV